tara:strand:+ start:751 stop:1320 length:570 start_codon:yes stop_codon:yes gene_type:complete
MRKSASEIIRNLEMRIAHLEKQSGAHSFEIYYNGTDAKKVWDRAVLNNRKLRSKVDPYGRYDGFEMATRQVMTEQQAEAFIKKELRTPNKYGKWDDAGCVAIGEEKILVSKDFEMEINARDKRNAIEQVRERKMGGRSRAGAVVEVEIRWEDVTEHPRLKGLYTVIGKRVQKKVGKVKGFIFFGFASDD